MIKWLCYKIMRAGRSYEHVAIDTGASAPIRSEDHTPDMEKAVRFAVLPARGGCVVETRTFNQKDHEWNVISHIIPEGTDVAKTVGDIVAMEMLRH